MTLPVSSVVDVNISVAPTAPAAPGFGVAALVTDENDLLGDWPQERILFYSSMEEVAQYYLPSSETYQILNTYFAQSPRPELAASITQYPLGFGGHLQGGTPVDDTIATWNAITDGSFHIEIGGVAADITALDFSLAADMAAVEGIIEQGLNDPIDPEYSGTTVIWDDTTKRFDIYTGPVGLTISFTTDVNPAVGTPISSLMLTRQTDGGTITAGVTPETPVDALTQAEQASAEWYGVMLLTKHRDVQSAEDVAAWVESRVKVLSLVSNNPNCLLTGNIDNILYRLNQSGLTRTMGIFSSQPSEYPDAAAFGEAFTTNFSAPNSVKTLKFKIFALVTPENLNSTQKSALDTIRGNASVTIGRTSMFAESYMASQLFFDERHSVDWLTGTLETNVFNYLSTRPTKVPLTDIGAASLEQQVIRGLDAAVFNGMLGAGTTSEGLFLGNGYIVTTQKVADMNPTDKANRIAPTISFIALLGSAVHFVQINGTIER